jgi:hypothetical protein
MLVDVALFHHELNTLKFVDIGERVAVHGDNPPYRNRYE